MNAEEKLKKVWIIGAGASIGHSQDRFPTINNFFAKSKGMELFSHKRTIYPEFQNVYEYIKNYFGKNIMSINEKIDIEQILTHLEININKYPKDSYHDIKEKIVNLIRKLLHNLAQEVNTGEYNLLKNRITNSETIITFNWDLLFDNILERDQILRHKYIGDIDYFIPNNQYNNTLTFLTALGENYTSGTSLLPYHKYRNNFRDSVGFYLKLHGSIDYVYCNNNSCRKYSKVFPVYDENKNYICGECHEGNEYLIIPPVLNKQYDKYPFIRRLWNTAAREIECANEIIIWGYSLPPTDFYSNWLFRQATTELKSVKIINPECVNISKDGNQSSRLGQAFLKKYQEIFLKKYEINKPTFECYYNFTDYTQNLKIEDKYKISPPKWFSK